MIFIFFEKNKKNLVSKKKYFNLGANFYHSWNLKDKIMKQYLSQRHKQLLGKYKKLKARLQRYLQKQTNLHRRKALYERMRKIYNQILYIEAQLKWSLSAGMLSVVFSTLSSSDIYAQNPNQKKFKYVERQLSLLPEDARYTAASSPTYPTFADIDEDGDKDLIVGLYRGGALWYKRNLDASNKPVYELVFNNDPSNPFKNVAAEMRSFLYFNPSFADVDGDGDLDMIVGYGDYYYDYVTLYKNVDGLFVSFTGAANPFFSVKMGTGVGIDGGARAEMIDADGDGDLDLFVSGSDDFLGNKYAINVKYYENYLTNTGVFVERTGAQNPLDHVLILPRPAAYYTGYGNLTFADIDNDGNLDAAIGEKYGLVYEYKGNLNTFGPQTINGSLSFTVISYGYYYPVAPCPAFQDFDEDGDLDVIFGDKYYNTLPYKKNNGSGVFTIVDYDVNDPANIDFKIRQKIVNVTVPNISCSAFADLDNDNDLDILVIGHGGQVRLMRNEGNEQFTVQNSPTILPSLTAPNNFPTFDLADFDNDGDADLVVKVSNGSTPRYFRNDGSNFTELTGSSNPFASVSISNFAKIQLVDIDGDSDLDLVAGDVNGIRVFINNGGNFTELTGTTNPFSQINDIFAQINNTSYKYSTPTVVDLDGDGDLDLVLGTFNDLSINNDLVFDKTRVYYFKNNEGNFELESSVLPFERVTVPIRLPILEFGDIDGDGDSDLALGEFRSPARVRYFEKVGNDVCPRITGEILEEIQMNQIYKFDKTIFQSVYTDEPDTQKKDFPKIKIIVPPRFGKLMIGGETMSFGSEIDFHSLSKMVYIPNDGYVGLDNFVWAAYDPVTDCYSNGGNFRFGVGTEVTAISDDLMGAVAVFPNPTKDKFNISLNKNLSGTVEIKLFGAIGNLVHRATYQEVSQVKGIDVSTLPNGLYLLQIDVGGKTGVFKLVKE